MIKFIIVITILINGVFSNSVQAAKNNDLSSRVFSAMNNYVLWEKKWYGDYFGSECVKKLPKKNNALWIGSCSPSGFAKECAVYLNKTNMFFSVSLSDKGDFAHIVTGERGVCNAGEYYPFVKKTKREKGKKLYINKIGRSENQKPTQEVIIDEAGLKNICLAVAKEENIATDVEFEINIATYQNTDPFMIIRSGFSSKNYLADYDANDAAPTDLLGWGTYNGTEQTKIMVERRKNELTKRVLNDSTLVRCQSRQQTQINKRRYCYPSQAKCKL